MDFGRWAFEANCDWVRGGVHDETAGCVGVCVWALATRERAWVLAERSAANIDLGKTPRQGSKARAQFDVRQQLANWAGADLTRINGLGLTR